MSQTEIARNPSFTLKARIRYVRFALAVKKYCLVGAVGAKVLNVDNI
jgi:hypothetical protein